LIAEEATAGVIGPGGAGDRRVGPVQAVVVAAISVVVGKPRPAVVSLVVVVAWPAVRRVVGVRVDA
jgi:hypothetical protein